MHFIPANYDVGNRELYSDYNRAAVKLALEEWRHWLEGSTQPFVVWTDHKNLAYIQTAKRLNSRKARWALFFNRFDFTLTYRPGSRNIKPDALSRQFSVEEKSQGNESILPASQVIAALTWDIETTIQQAQQQQPDPGGPPGCTFVPDSVRSQVLQWVHSSNFAFHPGINRMLSLVKRHFWWPSLDADVRGFVQACTICAWGKSSHKPQAGLLQPLPVPGRPCSHIALDFVTGLPLSNDFVSDRGPQFISQTNGQMERTNQDLETALRCITAANPSSWSSYLPWVEFSHNSLVSSATGLSPFEAPLGYRPPLFPRQERELAVPSIQHHLQRCKAMWQRTRAALEVTAQRNRQTADKHRSPAPQYLR
ncbi:hypothetical protein L3Q82_014659, partial [Scortum barcoo]